MLLFCSFNSYFFCRITKNSCSCCYLFDYHTSCSYNRSIFYLYFWYHSSLLPTNTDFPIVTCPPKSTFAISDEKSPMVTSWPIWVPIFRVVHIPKHILVVIMQFGHIIVPSPISLNLPTIAFGAIK